jgi:hypothetical protein
MPHADVANALGAVAGGVTQRASVSITQPQDGLYRAHLPTGVVDFTRLEEAVVHATDVAMEAARSMAERAGAGDIQLRHERDDKVFEDSGGLRIFMESTIVATAFGRPGLAR